MHEEVIAQFIALACKEWMAIEDEIRPIGVWIREYADISVKDIPLLRSASNTPVAVWYLSATGVQARSVDAWSLFWENSREPHSPARRTSREGIAAFATFARNTDLYWEYMWGPRWGAGWRMHAREDGVVDIVRQLWMS